MPGYRDEPLGREDSEALLEVRRELGVAYEAELVDSFADRIELAVAVRVDAQLAVRNQALAANRRQENKQMALAILSLVAAIPISIPVAMNAPLSALLVPWVGIILINVVFAFVLRRPGYPGGS